MSNLSRYPATKNPELPQDCEFAAISLRVHEVRGVRDGSITRLFRPIPFPQWVVEFGECKSPRDICPTELIGYSRNHKRQHHIYSYKIPFYTAIGTPFFYVKENWCLPRNESGFYFTYPDGDPIYCFEADVDLVAKIAPNSRGTGHFTSKSPSAKKMLRWSPPRSMPKDASRLLVELKFPPIYKTDRDFTTEDALAGGISSIGPDQFTCKHVPKFGVYPTALEAFKALWASTYGKTSKSPFLMVVDCEKVTLPS